ncbi:exodeoxyribonuclease VII small subunit [Corynebacterium uropygiale]|uniref:Exodeoxyribonuclease 7 small subunit n=1 Tax=Corynebacterium uropygiale TaxID=1775911 RepID=A0A9X1QTQ5_9CORY|nr:exodeoxyribonuclease VII small subunit [Corynebacterium uropygiale]MCF4006855.1 exodeoxyribonuclease VII small subunit [Corynebacterium uropygiale]
MATDTFGTGQPGENAFPPVAELTYEQARAELIETVRILEAGQMSLDESLRFWERGEELARRCEEHLDGASRRVEAALARSRGAETAGDGTSAPQNDEDEDEA